MKKLFECKVNYCRQLGEDNPSKVNETYLVEAGSPAEAEKLLIDELQPIIFGDFEVRSIKKRNFMDCLINNVEDNFYECKVEMIFLDEYKETRKCVTLLVREEDLKSATSRLIEYTSQNDVELVMVKKSSIIDVIKSAENESNN